MIDVSIQGIQELMADSLRATRAIRPSGALGRVVKRVGLATLRWIDGVVHVDTGALRASQRIDFIESGNEATAIIFVDPTAVNPKGQYPAEYGVYENRRGGSHAFYDIGADYAQAYIATEAINTLSVEILGA